MLTQPQRDILRTKLRRQLDFMTDEQLLALAYNVGYTTDDIERFCRDF